MHEHAEPLLARSHDFNRPRWTAPSALAEHRGSAAGATGFLAALLLLGARADQANAAQVNPDRISDKHDGRRGA